MQNLLMIMKRQNTYTDITIKWKKECLLYLKKVKMIFIPIYSSFKKDINEIFDSYNDKLTGLKEYKDDFLKNFQNYKVFEKKIIWRLALILIYKKFL